MKAALAEPAIGGRRRTATVDVWRREAVATPGVSSDGTRGRTREERMRSPEVGGAVLGRREGRYKGRTRKPDRRLWVKSEEAIGSDEGEAAQPTGAKGLCLSQATNGGGAA